MFFCFCFLFLTKPYKVFPFSKRQNQPISNKNSIKRMLGVLNISKRNSVYHISGFVARRMAPKSL